MATTTTSPTPQRPWQLPRLELVPAQTPEPGPPDPLDRALDRVLRPLGLHGLWRVGLPVLGALVLGDPLLLVGPHGTAKSLLARALARALGCRRLRTYDASKAQLEDVLGFPIPQSLAEGEVRYASTPISLPGADAVLVDELSRATPGMQSKWLEVIRGRTLLGLELTELRFVVAAMNPLGYDGTYPLDEALAGRFAAVVVVPTVEQLDPDERRAVIALRGEDDAPSLARDPRARCDGGPLRDVVGRARERLLLADFEAGEGRHDPEADRLVTWVDGLAQGLAQSGVALDGRRLGMLCRMARAGLAVARELTGEHPLEACGEVLQRVLRGGLPFPATGREVGWPLVRAVHEAAFAAALGKPGLGLWSWPSDPLALPRALRGAGGGAGGGACGARSLHEKQEALTRLLEQAQDAELEPEERAHALLAVALVARDVTRGEVALLADDRHRTLEAYRELLALGDVDPRALGEELGAPVAGLLDARRGLCLRVARRALASSGRPRVGRLRGLAGAMGRGPEPGAVQRLARELEARLPALLEGRP